MQNLGSLFIMCFSEILIWGLLFFIKKQKKSQLRKVFTILLFGLSFWTGCLILQILFQDSSVDPFLFEKIAAFAAFFVPVIFFYFSKVFSQTKIKFSFANLSLLILPTISLCLVLTNDIHHFFVIDYSTNINLTKWGPYFTIYSIYTYTLYAIGLIHLLRYTFKNAGFFSKQSFLIIIGTLIPIISNVIGTLGIIPMTVYVTPISLTFTVIFFAIAIFKFKFLSITPIALQRIVDRMSDSYIVLNEDNVVIDFNQSFLDTFHQTAAIRNINFFTLLKKQENFSMDLEVLYKTISQSKITPKTQHLEKHFEGIDKYFNIEISSIVSKGSYLGTLILLKDITQHITDMKTIEANQDLLVEKERLASLGQMIGGIAHNLKTPIMSIAGASQGILDLITEYRTSIGDPEVTIEDHHAIANDMETWVNKIKTHTEYMSDVITAVKGQAVAFSSNENNRFTVEEALKYTSVLMRHELSNALITLNVINHIDPSLELHGNINSLVQVINNIISNSIQAYNGTPNQKIDFIIDKNENNVIFSIKDYGMGINPEVKDKLFKEMVTTKGKNGTGLGLFMSYSNIRAHFNGNITFESEEGKGTIFHIIIPI